MITLMVIVYIGYIFIGLYILDKIADRILWKSWCDPFLFFGFIFWAFLPFLIAADICYGV